MPGKQRRAIRRLSLVENRTPSSTRTCGFSVDPAYRCSRPSSIICILAAVLAAVWIVHRVRVRPPRADFLRKRRPRAQWTPVDAPLRHLLICGFSVRFRGGSPLRASNTINNLRAATAITDRNRTLRPIRALILPQRSMRRGDSKISSRSLRCASTSARRTKSIAS
jgi:hypothetical protein